MGIADYIQRKKREFFVARDTDKLELQHQALSQQRESLVKERVELERVRKLQDEVRAEQRAVKDLRTAGTQRMKGNAFAGLQRLNENIKKLSGDNKTVNTVRNLSNDNPTTFRDTLHMDNNHSPFVVEKTPPTKAPKGKTITIRLRE